VITTVAMPCSDEAMIRVPRQAFIGAGRRHSDKNHATVIRVDVVVELPELVAPSGFARSDRTTSGDSAAATHTDACQR